MTSTIAIALSNLSHRKARTALTLLGVIIGIAAVVALISMGNGLSGSVAEQLESLGTNRIFITPRGQSSGFGPPTSSAAELTDRDIDIIENVKGVDIALPVLFRTVPVKIDDTTTFISAIGVPPDKSEEFFNDVESFDVAEGRQLRETDRTGVVVGSNVANLFAGDIRVRSGIEIFSKQVRVVGILEPTGDQTNDNGMIMSIDLLRELVNDDEATSVVLVRAFGTADDVRQTAADIERELEDFHDEELFEAFTSEQLLNQITGVFGLLSIVLVGIASISLLVAGIGIMNTMLMNVLERTREIGVMKAIGATNKRVLSMFVVEAALIGLIGGIVGTVLGYLIAFAFSGFAVNFVGLALRIVIDPSIVALGLGFATIVGVVCGTYPAYRASKLDPVEALRYE